MPFRARLAASLLFAAVSASGQTVLHLIPMPREVTAKGDQPLSGVQIVCSGCDAEDNFSADDLRQTLADRGVPSASGTGLRITLKRSGNGFTAPMQEEGYTITSGGGTLTLTRRHRCRPLLRRPDRQAADRHGPERPPRPPRRRHP